MAAVWHTHSLLSGHANGNQPADPGQLAYPILDLPPLPEADEDEENQTGRETAPDG